MIGSLSRLQLLVPRYKTQGHQLPVGFTSVQSILLAHFSPSLFDSVLVCFPVQSTVSLPQREKQQNDQRCATKSSKDMRYAAAFITGTLLIHVNGMVNKGILSPRSWFWWDLPVPLMHQDALRSDLHQISNLPEVAHGTTLGTRAPAIIHPLVADEGNDDDSSYIQNQSTWPQHPQCEPWWNILLCSKKEQIQAGGSKSMDTRRLFP